MTRIMLRSTLGLIIAVGLSAAALAADLAFGPKGDTVTVDSFKAVLAANPAAIAVIDVRDAKEFAKGHFATAANIPVGDLEAKLDGLPKDKPVVFVCSTGARSGEAYDIVKMLKEDIKNVYFLDAEVTYNADGTQVITARK